MTLPNRRPCITEDVGTFAVTVSYDPKTGCPIEMFMTKRAKIGTDIENILYDLGVTTSKLMQE